MATPEAVLERQRRYRARKASLMARLGVRGTRVVAARSAAGDLRHRIDVVSEWPDSQERGWYLRGLREALSLIEARS